MRTICKCKGCPKGPDSSPGLSRLAGLPARQSGRAEAAQLVVDQRQQMRGGLRVALVDDIEDAGDVAHGGQHTAAVAGCHFRPGRGVASQVSDDDEPARLRRWPSGLKDKS